MTPGPDPRAVEQDLSRIIEAIKTGGKTLAAAELTRLYELRQAGRPSVTGRAPTARRSRRSVRAKADELQAKLEALNGVPPGPDRSAVETALRLALKPPPRLSRAQREKVAAQLTAFRQYLTEQGAAADAIDAKAARVRASVERGHLEGLHLRRRAQIRTHLATVAVTLEATRRSRTSSFWHGGPWLVALFEILKTFPEWRPAVRQCALRRCGRWFVGRRKGCTRNHQNRLSG